MKSGDRYQKVHTVLVKALRAAANTAPIVSYVSNFMQAHAGSTPVYVIFTTLIVAILVFLFFIWGWVLKKY